LAASDAATDNLLHTREAGWSIDPQCSSLPHADAGRTGRANFRACSAARQRQIEDLARWAA